MNKNFSLMDVKNLKKYAKASLRSRFTTLRSGRLTRDIREMPQLGISPNFAPTSQNIVYP